MQILIVNEPQVFLGGLISGFGKAAVVFNARYSFSTFVLSENASDTAS